MEVAKQRLREERAKRGLLPSGAVKHSQERGTSEKRGGTERTNQPQTICDERRPKRSGETQLPCRP